MNRQRTYLVGSSGYFPRCSAFLVSARSKRPIRRRSAGTVRGPVWKLAMKLEQTDHTSESSSPARSKMSKICCSHQTSFLQAKRVTYILLFVQAPSKEPPFVVVFLFMISNGSLFLHVSPKNTWRNTPSSTLTASSTVTTRLSRLPVTEESCRKRFKTSSVGRSGSFRLAPSPDAAVGGSLNILSISMAGGGVRVLWKTSTSEVITSESGGKGPLIAGPNETTLRWALPYRTKVRHVGYSAQPILPRRPRPCDAYFSREIPDSVHHG